MKYVKSNSKLKPILQYEPSNKTGKMLELKDRITSFLSFFILFYLFIYINMILVTKCHLFFTGNDMALR